MKTSVLIVFGGQSSEHNVSCLTAASVVKALDNRKYEVHAVGISKSGDWFRVPVNQVENLQTTDGKLPEVTDQYPSATLIRANGGVELATLTQNTLTDRKKISVAFTLLHGPFGEDGTIQGMFEMLGLRYVGAGVLSSAVSMDKHLMKVILAQAGIPIGPYQVIHPRQWVSDKNKCLLTASQLEFPVFVKPARGGSSVGISKVTDPCQLVPAIEFAQKYDPKVIVEQGIIDAREIECAVLESPDGNGPRTSLLGEIAMTRPTDFYDYEAKYLPGNEVKLKAPTELDEVTAKKVTELAKKTFQAVECEGLARVDTFVTSSGEVLVNEINTMPGFTRFSMFPALWEASGISYPQLIDQMIEMALARRSGLR